MVEAQSITATSVSLITQTDAQLNATADLTGGTGTYYIEFEYKLTSAPPFAWSSVGYSSGMAATATYNVNISLPSLTANTGYDYRARLLDNVGTPVGGYFTTVNFTTLSEPTATTDAASNVSITTADFSGSVALGGSSVSHNIYFYYREAGTSNFSDIAGTPSTTTTDQGSVTASVTGLSAATNYEYQTVLVNQNESPELKYYGTLQSFTTSAATTPTVTTGATAAVTSSTIEVTGNNISADGGSAITAHGLKGGAISGSGNYTFTKNGGSSVSPNTFDELATGLLASTKYYFSAFATNSAGTAYGSESYTYTSPASSSNFTSITGLDNDIKTVLTLNWVKGDGEAGGEGGRIIVIYRYLHGVGSSPTPVLPTDGTVYTANAAWGSGDLLSTENGYIVFAGSAGTDLEITGLDGAVYDYEFYVYEYSGSSVGEINYKTTSPGFISTDGTTFPIELLSFSAKSIEDRVEINWATATELNNDYFEIERSFDAENFELVVKIPGAGNSNEVLDYSIIDNDNLEGTVYYRLKQTDFDGVFTYSFILPVTIGGSDELQIGNVINDDKSISFVYNNSLGATTQVHLLDINGRIVKTQEVSGGGSHLVRMAMGNLSHGVYVLRLSVNDETIVKKLVY